jgi:hypothetical protein
MIKAYKFGLCVDEENDDDDVRDDQTKPMADTNSIFDDFNRK